VILNPPLNAIKDVNKTKIWKKKKKKKRKKKKIKKMISNSNKLYSK